MQEIDLLDSQWSPKIDIAIKLIKRVKGLFEPNLGVMFDSKETVLELNGCRIEVYSGGANNSHLVVAVSVVNLGPARIRIGIVNV